MKCFRSLLALFSMVLSGSAVATADAPPVSLNNLKPWLESVRVRSHVPTLAVAVVRDGKITAAATGFRKEGDPTPVKDGDAFHLGSCTKAMTATLVALLVQDGKLRWDETLAEIFPPWKAAMRPEYQTLTLRQILNQRSGFSAQSWPVGMEADFWQQSAEPLPLQRARYAQAILAEAPETAAGTQFIYSNRNYILAGAIAERVTGKSWEALMRERLFKPLGMKSAGFGPTASEGKVDGVWAHSTTEGKLVPVAGPRSDNPPALGPAGTVHCSLKDWGKYVRFVMESAHSQSQLLSEKSFEMLTRPLPGADYACGWQVLQRDWGSGPVLQHNGSNTLNYCVAWLAPRRNFAVVVATNMGTGEAVCDEVASALIAKLDKRIPGA